MKTIYRQLFFWAILTVAATAGSLSVTAQTPNPCDATVEAAAVAAYTEWTKLFELKDLPGRKSAVEKGKVLTSHPMYPKCDATKAGIEFVASSLPGMEAAIKKIEDKADTAKLEKRFNDGLAAKNWDEVYAAGKEALAKDPEKYRAAELVLGSIGLDETGKTPSNTKWNEDTLKFAKQSIADIEAGKKFSTWGLGSFIYKNKEDALGWMNYTIGIILFNDKKDKKAAAEYMYKVTQGTSEKKNEPVAYSVIASYYVLDLNKNIEELKALPGPVEADTPEVKQQKVDAIKDKTGMVNGAAERVMDAYARAYNFASPTATNKAYRDGLKASFKQIYDIRFQKPDATTPTVDAWIASVSAKPFVNPSTPVVPVQDAEKTAVTPTATPAGGPVTTVKPVSPSNVKPTTPAGAKPTAPGTKPAPAGTKPGVAAVKKKTKS